MQRHNFYSSFGRNGFSWGWKYNFITNANCNYFHSSCLARLPAFFFFLNLINLKMWKMKLQVVKQRRNSTYCSYGFYSRTPKNIKIFIIIFNILLTSLQEQIYLWKVAVNSEWASLWNLAFFLLKGDLFAEFCELY